LDKQGYIQQVREELKNEVKHNKTSIEKLAKTFGITNKNLVKEYTELAIVLNARQIASRESFSAYEKYNEIVALYKNQVNLSMRTSMSVLMQQYSTLFSEMWVQEFAKKVAAMDKELKSKAKIVDNAPKTDSVKK